ncbi:MAG: hypothetical protein U9R53_04920 [Chloroflexota bacterium]|nr:hypothetical protein [Chloroflexota bacterium]
MQDKYLRSRKSETIRNLVITLFVIAGLLLFPASVQARKLFYAKTIPSEQVIEQDVFLTGPQPTIEGTVNGDVFIVGSEAAINGNVNGSVFVLAEKLDLTGKVGGNLYVAAVEVNQPTDGQIDRSLYALVLSLITESDSSIGRDLNLVAMSARLQGSTSGNTAAIIGPWETLKVLWEFLNQNITGFTSNQPAVAKVETEPIPARSGIPHLASIRVKEKDTDPSALAEWGIEALKSLLNFIVVGGLVLWMFPRKFKVWASKVKEEPLTSAGYGVLVLINGYLVPVVGLFLVSGLLIGLLVLSLPSLALTFFGIGFGLLLTIFTIFQAAITFISKAIVAYLVGSLILSKIVPGGLKYSFLPLLLGLLIYVPLASIPYIGFVIGLLTTLLGLGAIWLGVKKISQQGQEAVGSE